MTRIILAASAALVLAGCSTIDSARTEQLATRVLGNLQGCQRTYTAQLGGFAPSASLSITCLPVSTAAPAPEPIVTP
jgi:hypothetical protein